MRRPTLASGDCGYVADVCVREGWRGRGIGRQLYERLRAWFLAHGITAIEVQVVRANPASQAFWRKMGYTEFLRTLRVDMGSSAHDDHGLQDLLGLRYPICQAPTGSIAGPELAAAVSGAGALGRDGADLGLARSRARTGPAGAAGNRLPRSRSTTPCTSRPASLLASLWTRGHRS